jgi:hypothetical protein
MREDDFAYFSRRSGEELVAAVNARSVVASRVHRDLADRFKLRAKELRQAMPQVQSTDAA